MKCSRCQHENPGDAVFCQECGTQLEVACPSCGTPNGPSAKFCKKCGQSLTGSQAAQAVPDPRFGSPESYTPKHLAERILTSKTALEGERNLVPSPNAALLNAEPALSAYLAECFAAVGPPPVVADKLRAVVDAGITGMLVTGFVHERQALIHTLGERVLSRLA